MVFATAVIPIAIAIPVVIMFEAPAPAVPIARVETLSIMMGSNPVGTGIWRAGPVSSVPTITAVFRIPIAVDPRIAWAGDGRPNRDDAWRRRRANSYAEADLSNCELAEKSSDGQEGQCKNSVFHVYSSAEVRQDSCLCEKQRIRRRFGSAEEAIGGPCALGSVIISAPDALPEKQEQPAPELSRAQRLAASLKRWARQLASRRWARICAAAAALACVLFLVVYGYYARVIDQRLQGGPFADSVNVYAAPLSLSVGDEASAAGLGVELRSAGYRESAVAAELSYKVRGESTVEIIPAGGSGLGTRVFLANGRIVRIENNGQDLRELNIAAPLITTLSRKKEERLLVRFDAIPPVLVDAILSAEDKRFFHHDGVDLPRIAKAAFVDMKEGRKEQGASTLTMQLVRGLWLGRDKQWKRKLAEVMMTIHLEREWSKEKIFETYVNQVYLGRQADYSMHGFGEGARLFFGKELKDITLPEAALLAGMVQRPSHFNPFRYPERAKERRDVVLAMMRSNDYITSEQFDQAVNEPVHVTGDALSEARAPYFLDLVNDELQAQQAQDSQPDDESIRSVYSTIDLNLQRAADEAVKAGMQNVDQLLSKRTGKPGPKAEVALIALDPHTGEIKALVGGRNYQRSQLNRILSKRPPGSVFKPFVYAAALDSAISGGRAVYTPASTVDDSATTFWFGGKAVPAG